MAGSGSNSNPGTPGQVAQQYNLNTDYQNIQTQQLVDTAAQQQGRQQANSVAPALRADHTPVGPVQQQFIAQQQAQAKTTSLPKRYSPKWVKQSARQVCAKSRHTGHLLDMVSHE